MSEEINLGAAAYGPKLRTTRKSIGRSRRQVARTVVSKNANEPRTGDEENATGKRARIVVVISLRSNGAYLMIINVLWRFSLLLAVCWAGLRLLSSAVWKLAAAIGCKSALHRRAVHLSHSGDSYRGLCGASVHRCVRLGQTEN